MLTRTGVRVAMDRIYCTGKNVQDGNTDRGTANTELSEYTERTLFRNTVVLQKFPRQYWCLLEVGFLHRLATGPPQIE